MGKFVGKFRKNKEYNDDYTYTKQKKHRNEHAEIKKIKNRDFEDILSDYENENIPQKHKGFHNYSA